MKNSELVRTKRQGLSPIEKQRQYILRCLLQKNECSNCGHALNFFEGAGLDIDDWREKIDDTECHCTACKRQLVYVVPAFVTGRSSGWHWRLMPIDPKR